MNRKHTAITVAAGGVLWRKHKSHLQVALVHRPRYDDWSIPKGKVESHEFLTTTVVRELLEETGYKCSLQRYLTKINYKLNNNTLKEVHYWACQVIEGDFRINSEVNELRWLSIAQALKLLSHNSDKRVLYEFVKQPIPTNSLLLIRHAKTDNLPNHAISENKLDSKGKLQALNLIQLLTAFNVSTLISAPLPKCIKTLTPYADLQDNRITQDSLFSEIDFFTSPNKAFKKIVDLVTKDQVTAICTQEKIITELLTKICYFINPKKIMSKKASVWVLSYYKNNIISADYYENGTLDSKQEIHSFII